MAKRIGLRMLRIKNDLTQEQFAARCGMSKTNYCLIEQGKRAGTISFWHTVQKEFNLSGDEIWKLI